MGKANLGLILITVMLAGCGSSDENRESAISGHGGSANPAGTGGVSGQSANSHAGGAATVDSGADNGGVIGGASGTGTGGSGAGPAGTSGAGTGGSATEPMDGSLGDGATATQDAGNDASITMPTDSGDAQTGEIKLFPVNGSFDYQIGSAYSPPAGVTIVTRDRNARPAAGVYNICYINGYQTQPGEEGLWEADLILRDSGGNPVVDPNWGETLLDVSTADKRTRIAVVVGGWIEKCAADGFDAVEIDNLDTYSRSGGRITQDNAVAFIALLSDVAHSRGLAIAQKNSTDIIDRRAEMKTDFAVAEECSTWNECDDYVDVYGEYVLMIEYNDSDFRQGCEQYGATHPIVRRDLYLVSPSSPAYVFDNC